jgi:TRAP-type mannitol/chloroaromatic compound transport system substrate-binding protein
MKITKYLILIGITLALAISLVAGACGPAAPTDGEGDGAKDAEIASLEAEIADLEDDLDSLESAKDAEIKDLEDELAALQKPTKVYRWEPATWISAGMSYDRIVYWSNHLNELSDGRIVSTPSAPGAVVPVEEQIEAVGDGTTMVMFPTPSYYAGKFPAAAIFNTSIGVRSSIDQWYAYEIFENGRIEDIYFKAVEDRYNVHVLSSQYSPVQAIMSLTQPVSRITDLNGLKFRCGDDHFAGPLNELGCSTVWAPGTEIYTMLATGVVDGFTYGSAYDHYAQGFHEVTSHWVKNEIMASMNEQIVINNDLWNELPDDLKYLMRTASDAANMRGIPEGYAFVDQAWVSVQEYGIEQVVFPDEDIGLWTELQLAYLEQYEGDPEAGEMVQLLEEFAGMKGYL